MKVYLVKKLKQIKPICKQKMIQGGEKREGDVIQMIRCPVLSK